MKIGILGCGTIGGGVLKMIDELDKDIVVKKVFDLPFRKDELKERFAEKIDDVTRDNEIEVVVECMGGDEVPYKAIKDALTHKKSVVTSNKEVVSRHMEEFYKLARENDVYFYNEASVGGGIPIICTLIESVKANNVNHIYGIINGTTNFILSKMEIENYSFKDALKLAQELGFAEKDPTADLEGLDMTRKICILSSIAYKGYINPDLVYHRGIGSITKEILNEVNKLGYRIKFVADSQLKDGKILVSVEPTLLSLNNPLSSVYYEYNSIYYDCDKNATLGFYGKGAGRFPTATAMVQDIIRISEKGEKYYFQSLNNYSTQNYFGNSKYFVYKNGKGEIVDILSQDDAAAYEFVARVF